MGPGKHQVGAASAPALTQDGTRHLLWGHPVGLWGWSHLAHRGATGSPWLCAPRDRVGIMPGSSHQVSRGLTFSRAGRAPVAGWPVGDALWACTRISLCVFFLATLCTLQGPRRRCNHTEAPPACLRRELAVLGKQKTAGAGMAGQNKGACPGGLDRAPWKGPPGQLDCGGRREQWVRCSDAGVSSLGNQVGDGARS